MNIWLILSTLLVIDDKILATNIIVPANLQVQAYGESLLNESNIVYTYFHPKNIYQKLAQDILDKGKKMLYHVANINYFFLKFVENKRLKVQVHSNTMTDYFWAKEKLRQYYNLQDIKLDYTKMYKVR